jgi:adenylate kinase family enzyme
LLLAKKYNVKLAGSGAFLRKFKAKEYVSGGPAPVKMIFSFLDYSLKNVGDKDIVFIGAARLKPEAQYLVKQLKKRNRDFFAVYIKLPKREVIKRSLLRAAREEDTNLKLIEGRIKYYKNQVSKTVKYYQSLRKLKFINGQQSIKQVSQDIQKAINDYERSQKNRTA